MTWTIETYGLTKRFPAPASLRRLFAAPALGRPAVDGVDLQVREGELFGLLGPNGAGKTTLIKMLCTLVAPTSGRAAINGYDLHQETAIKRSVGLATSDERSFYWRLSGRQNLEFFASLHGLTREEARPRVERLLAQFELDEVANRRFQTYSTGMRQRLSIARALLNEPRLLFLDEPSKGLDPTATRQLHELIHTLAGSNGITIFLTTHHLEEAEQLCDRIAIMNRGRICACGTLDELRQTLDLQAHYRLRVRGFREEVRASLQRCVGSLQVTAPDGGPAGVETLVEFPAPRDPAGLTAALDTLRQEQVTIAEINHQPASLESIFTQLVENDKRAMAAGGTPAAPLALPADLPAAPRAGGGPGIRPSLRSRGGALGNLLRGALRTVLAFLRRDVVMEASYRISFALQFVNILFSVGIFYFIAQLLGNAVLPHLVAYGGDYFSYVLIGIAFASYFSLGLSGFSRSIREAQTTGTLEAMLSTPTNLSIIVLSSSLWDYFMTTLKVLIYLLVGAVFLGVNLGRGNYPGAVLILLLTVVVFSCMGILAASFIMVLKRGDPITWVFSSISSLLGGVYYPVAVLPGWLQALSWLIPITYSLRGMRMALLQGASFAALLPDILALLAFAVLLLPLSLLAFRYAVQRAKVDGSLTHY